MMTFPAHWYVIGAPPARSVHGWVCMGVVMHVNPAHLQQKLAHFCDFHVTRCLCAQDFLNGLKNLSFMTTARWFFQVNELALRWKYPINTIKIIDIN